MKTFYSKITIAISGLVLLLCLLSTKTYAGGGCGTLSGVVTKVMANESCTVTCPGATITFQDPGGTGDYANSEDITQTFTSTGPLQISFSSFNTESGWDYLYVHDGANTGAAQVAGSPFNGTTLPPTITSSGNSLTFRFTSDGSGIRAGWQGTITCLAACSGAPTPGTAVASPNTICSGASTNLSVTGATTGSGLTYQWQSAPAAGGPWTSVGGATSATFSPSPGTTTHYRRIINCGASTSTSSSVMVSVGSPANDECASAIVLTVNSDFNCGTVTAGTINCASASAQANACAGTDDDDVWYQFVATSTMHRVSLLNVAGSTTDMYIAVYGGACGALGTALICSDPETANISGLTIGATYRVRVYSYTSTTGQNTTFNICIGSPVVCNIASSTIIDMSDFGNCTITSCGATVTFRDPQGNSNYNASQDVTHTFTNSAGTPLQAVFNVFDTESCCDELYIYDGPSSASPQVPGSPFMGTTLPPTIISSGASLTFRFTPDGSTQGAGFRTLISCLPACSGAPTGGTATSSQSVICSSQAVDFSVTGATAASGMTYQWQSSTNNSTWTNIAGATSANTTQTVSASTYYRRIITCTSSGGTANSASVFVMFNSNACNLNYSSSSIAYSNDALTLTNSLTFGDDQLSGGKVPLGFTFCFDGRPYTDAYISSNFAIVFDALCGVGNINTGTGTVAAPSASNGYTISGNMPSTSQTMPRNAIMLWQDVAPHYGGSGPVTYQTLGTAPNRRFVLSFRNVPMYSCSTSFTAQIKIFETTNNIEIHVQDKPVCATFNGGLAAMGLQDYDGTSAVVPAGKNGGSASWTATNEAWRFTTTCATCIVPLAIDLLSFEGEKVKNGNRIFWKTASEKDNSGFVLQKSIDGEKFNDLATVDAKSSKGGNYEVLDTKPYEVTYYRLVDVDFNGKTNYSNIISINALVFDYTETMLLKPNPATENITIDAKCKVATKGELQIYNITGKLVMQSTVELKEGNNFITHSVSDLDNGVYFVKIVTSDLSNSSTIKFIKQ